MIGGVTPYPHSYLLDVTVRSDTRRVNDLVMTCYHPLKGFVLGVKPNGKKELYITSYETEFLDLVGSVKVPRPKGSDAISGATTVVDYVLIPCGQCIGCRLQYSKDWATRMMLESKYHESNSFITLTYDDFNLPLSEYVDSNGEFKTSMTLVKRHFQLFMKRLRKAIAEKYDNKKIRFYACGEYGSMSFRPHYHAIIFGFDFPDRQPLKLSDQAYSYWRSPLLESVWTYGYSMVCDVSFETCAYVARYVTKKHKGIDRCYYDYHNIVPEFSTMSRKPGIARLYYDEHKDEIYMRDEIFLATDKGGRKVRPPRYYDQLFDLEYHDEMEFVKEMRREISDNICNEKLRRTNLNYFQLLEAEEKVKSDAVKALRRDRI